VGRLRARRGEPGAAQALEEALALAHATNHRQRLGFVYAARAEAAWLNGDRERTLSEAHALGEGPRGTQRVPGPLGPVENQQPGFAAELAYWRWRAGEQVETFDWMVGSPPGPFVLEMQGEWRSAAAAWAALGCPYEQARALAEGDVEAQLAALTLFEQLGARPMMDVVRHRLRTAGVQTLPRGPRPATKDNPFQLTNRQVEILRLLTEELTNAEIAARLTISAKTVDHHVSAILAKLDVSSRGEAAELARRLPEL
jgi:DNA-binding CsgD family transcriptional regulator